MCAIRPLTTSRRLREEKPREIWLSHRRRVGLREIYHIYFETVNHALSPLGLVSPGRDE